MPGRKLVKKSAKEEVVKDLAEKFKASQAVIFTEYRGLSVAQVTRLRSELKDCDYIVAKNTLARIAAKEAGMNGVDDQLTGPSAIVVMGENYVENARILRDFSKSEPKLKVKGGYVDGSVMSVEEVKGFCKGNVIKYVARAGKKPNTDAIEDLTKARTYIARLIEMETTANGKV